MQTRRIGELDVSLLGLGCNNFGMRIDAAQTDVVVGAAIDAGVTYFDTANAYGGGGKSEELLGGAIAGRRDQVIVATKFGHPAMLGEGETPGRPDLIVCNGCGHEPLAVGRDVAQVVCLDRVVCIECMNAVFLVFQSRCSS